MKLVLNKHFHDLMSPKGGRDFLESLLTLTCHTALSRLVKFQLVRSRTALAKVVKFQLVRSRLVYGVWSVCTYHLNVKS